MPEQQQQQQAAQGAGRKSEERALDRSFISCASLRRPAVDGISPPLSPPRPLPPVYGLPVPPLPPPPPPPPSPLPPPRTNSAPGVTHPATPLPSLPSSLCSVAHCTRAQHSRGHTATGRAGCRRRALTQAEAATVGATSDGPQRAVCRGTVCVSRGTVCVSRGTVCVSRGTVCVSRRTAHTGRCRRALVAVHRTSSSDERHDGDAPRAEPEVAGSRAEDGEDAEFLQADGGSD